MKLKTLKDLHKEFVDSSIKSVGIHVVGVVSYERLKEEAIKWIKEIKTYEADYLASDGEDIRTYWIKHFFNITEEDLNDKKANKG